MAPEVVFDQGLGDLFVCRVAGNVLEPHVLGSIEYAVENFGCALVVVLGHQRCGAVTDTIALVDAGETAPGSIQRVVDAIAPVIRGTRREAGDDDYVEEIVRANASAVAQSLLDQSTIVTDAASDEKLRVVAATYSLDSGKVDLLS